MEVESSLVVDNFELTIQNSMRIFLCKKVMPVNLVIASNDCVILEGIRSLVQSVIVFLVDFVNDDANDFLVENNVGSTVVVKKLETFASDVTLVMKHCKNHMTHLDFLFTLEGLLMLAKVYLRQN